LGNSSKNSTCDLLTKDWNSSNIEDFNLSMDTYKQQNKLQAEFSLAKYSEFEYGFYMELEKNFGCSQFCQQENLE